MNDNKKYLLMAIVLGLLGLFGPGFMAEFKQGGQCEFTDESLLTRVTSVNRQRVELEPVFGLPLALLKSKFDSPQVNDYYSVVIRRHTSGGCSPFSIIDKQKLVIDNLQLGPSNQQVYAASFILDVARNCSVGPLTDSCKEELALDSTFDLAQLPLLRDIKPRSVGYCSATVMDKLLPVIESALLSNKTSVSSSTRLISCVDNGQGEQIALEFSLAADAKLSLRKIH